MDFLGGSACTSGCTDGDMVEGFAVCVDVSGVRSYPSLPCELRRRDAWKLMRQRQSRPWRMYHRRRGSGHSLFVAVFEFLMKIRESLFFRRKMLTPPAESAQDGAVENVVFTIVKLLFNVGKRLFFVGFSAPTVGDGNFLC